MTSYSSFDYFTVFSDSVRRITDAAKVTGDFNQIARLEQIPDLKSLYPSLDKGLFQLAAFRSSKTSEQFRRWLATVTSGNSDIVGEYLAAISEKSGPLEKPAGKFLKSVALTAIGIAAGLAIEASPLGAAAGGIASKVLEPAADLGLDLLDEFVLGRIVKGFSPRMFFDDLKQLDHPDLRGGR